MRKPRSCSLVAGLFPHGQLPILTEDGALTFKSDGTFTASGIVCVGGKEKHLETEGKWSVQDGILIEALTASSDAQMAPVGWITRDTLLALTEKEYRFRTVDKAEYTYHRK
jgi:hypothetical protein